MVEFGALNWSIVAIYLVANIGLGWLMSRRIKTSKDYYLGDRSAPWWAIGISVIATYVSALSFLGGPAWVYGDGMAILALHINYALVVFVCIVLFIPVFYNSGVASIYEYLERRFGPKARAVMGLLFLLNLTLAVGSIVAITSLVITFATGMDVQTAIIVLTAIVIFYTMLGGMNAVIWTDVLQAGILIAGAIIILVALLNQTGPMNESLSFLNSHDKLNPIITDFDMSLQSTIWAGVFAMSLYHIMVYGPNQFMVQRVLAAKNIGDAKKAYLMMGFGGFFLYFLFFFIGALLFVYYEGEPFEQYNQIMLVFANSLAIPGLMGVLGAAILSASMSSTSSALNSLSTVSITDFYQKYFNPNQTEQHYLMASRVATVFWGVLLIPIAIAYTGSTGSIFAVMSKVGSYFAGSILAMFLMGFFSKHATQRGVLAGVVGGIAGLLFFAPFSILIPPVDSIWNALGLQRPEIAWPWYVPIALVFNVIVTWLVSVISDGFKSEWHPDTVKGQIQTFEKEGKPLKSDGWYVVPGKVDPVVWLLPAFFVLIMVFLVWFGSLG